MAIGTEFLERLNDLLMLDHDAVEAYDQAVRRIASASCAEKLRAFQEDHRRHILDLTACISRYGGTPKNRTDVKGFFIKGMTAMQSAMGDESALKAMQTNERLTNRDYQKVLEAAIAWPADVLSLLQRNRADEARHLAWIENALATRAWEERPSAPSI